MALNPNAAPSSSRMHTSLNASSSLIDWVKYREQVEKAARQGKELPPPPVDNEETKIDVPTTGSSGISGSAPPMSSTYDEAKVPSADL